MSKFSFRALATVVPLVAIVSGTHAVAESIPSAAVSATRSATLPADLSSYKPLLPMLSTLRAAQTPSIESSMSKTSVAPSVVPGTPGPAAGKASTPPPDTTIGARNYGTGNLGSINHFSDKYVPTSSAYPYSTTGWFYFTKYNGSTARCTASLISRSVLLTAGHCVHKGGGGSPYWIKSGTYVPSYANGSQPYGNAPALRLYTTAGWFNTGALDQGYDVALVVLGKRSGTATEIGAYTGTLGFCYSNCLQTYWMNTQVGYPANYYNGAYMTESQHLEYSDGKDYRAGTGMQGGSSGGPHIANIGSLSDTSTSLGSYTSRNVAFAVTSWGYTNQAIKIGGFSSLSGPANANNFKVMYNTACSYARSIHGTGSCGLLP